MGGEGDNGEKRGVGEGPRSMGWEGGGWHVVERVGLATGHNVCQKNTTTKGEKSGCCSLFHRSPKVWW